MEKNFEFDDVDDEELDFVQSREKIPVTLHITAINKHNENKDKEMKTIKDHIENLDYIMDSMPDDACGDWRDSIAYAIENLKEKMNNGYDTDQLRKEFIDRYPKNCMGGWELDGRSCYFSLNEVLQILDKYKKEKNS